MTEHTREHSGHTPGPWRIQPDGQGIMFSGSAGFSFKPWGNNEPLSKADARLIAAAPEMLAIIQATAELPCMAQIDQSDCDDENLCGLCNRANGARALLARIEGGK